MSDSVRETAVFELPKERSTSLRCTACADRACESVGRVPGVVRVECDSAHSQVRVEFNTLKTTAADIERQLSHSELEFEQAIAHKAWRVSGLD
ncbi:MAG TPA: cation transporter [Coriobacteriia bacterium]|nr:cation transporter [Coriobacteriia bacterium]